jgi:hypothetical protein
MDRDDAPADDERCESGAASLETDADAEEDEEDHDAIPTTEEVANRVGATGEEGKDPSEPEFGLPLGMLETHSAPTKVPADRIDVISESRPVGRLYPFGELGSTSPKC